MQRWQWWGLSYNNSQHSTAVFQLSNVFASKWHEQLIKLCLMIIWSCVWLISSCRLHSILEWCCVLQYYLHILPRIYPACQIWCWVITESVKLLPNPEWSPGYALVITTLSVQIACIIPTSAISCTKYYQPSHVTYNWDIFNPGSWST